MSNRLLKIAILPIAGTLSITAGANSGAFIRSFSTPIFPTSTTTQASKAAGVSIAFSGSTRGKGIAASTGNNGFSTLTRDIHTVTAEKPGSASSPFVSSTIEPVAGPTAIMITGLPPTLTRINVSWWNGNASFDDNVGSYGDYGRPSTYYIDASANGSNWTALNHVIGNTYNGRQFVFDIAGKRYTQIRLRVVSIVGANAGKVRLSVHSIDNNSNDSYLLLGDSITSNCWAAAANAFPNEAFESGVHSQHPNRYPIATEGGIPGLLSSSPLSTTPYNIPVIRQWLTDFAAVKYVGLSYGTNDANQRVSAAIYCSNMQAMAQEVIAAGKIPIIPTIVASPSSAVQADAPAMNACLAALESKFPAIIKGPDLWKLFSRHSVDDGWFFDTLHPSLTTGCRALQKAWVNNVNSTIDAN